MIQLMAGTFDPFTNGHADLARRAAAMADKLIVAVAVNATKQCIFTTAERIALIRLALADCDNIEVIEWQGLVVDACKQYNAGILVRGIRNEADFAYESKMAQTNKLLCPDIETILLMARCDFATVSATMVRSIIELGGSLDNLVPKTIVEPLWAYYKAKSLQSREDD